MECVVHSSSPRTCWSPGTGPSILALPRWSSHRPRQRHPRRTGRLRTTPTHRLRTATPAGPHGECHSTGGFWGYIYIYIYIYNCGQTTWRVSDRYERLVTVAVEVLATPCWKQLSQVSVLDSSSSRAVESIVRCVSNYENNRYQFPGIATSPTREVVCRYHYHNTAQWLENLSLPWAALGLHIFVWGCRNKLISWTVNDTVFV
jgi:hypothetical protein